MIPYHRMEVSGPWIQDLMLIRALVEIFFEPVLAEGLAFRGGTTLHKFHLKSVVCYSEEIDLVQIDAVLPRTYSAPNCRRFSTFATP